MITIIRKWINSVSRTYRYIRLTIIRLKGTHEEVAEGMALGIFIGMTPTMGIQVYLAFVASMFLKKNKIAAILGVFITNPFTVIPIYTLHFKVGTFLLRSPNLTIPDFSSLSSIFSLGLDIIIPLVVGSIPVAIIASIIAYVITLRFSRIYRNKKFKKKIKEKTKIPNCLKKSCNKTALNDDLT